MNSSNAARAITTEEQPVRPSLVEAEPNPIGDHRANSAAVRAADQAHLGAVLDSRRWERRGVLQTLRRKD